MNQNTAKTRSYLELLVVLLAIMVVLPLLEFKDTLLNNIIFSLFFLLFLLAVLNVAVTKGVAPRRKLYKWTIRLTILVSFTADIVQSVISTVIGRRSGISFHLEPLLQLSGREFWLEFLGLIAVVGYAFLTLFLIIMILRDLFSGNRVQLNKIFGAIVAYLLLGIFWAFLYSALILLQPASLARGSGVPITSYAEAIYFSFVSLCTVGYGDIVPQGHLAMVFANLEAVAGQLYLAILVARLVALYTSHNPGREAPDGKP